MSSSAAARSSGGIDGYKRWNSALCSRIWTRVSDARILARRHFVPPVRYAPQDRSCYRFRRGAFHNDP